MRNWYYCPYCGDVTSYPSEKCDMCGMGNYIETDIVFDLMSPKSLDEEKKYIYEKYKIKDSPLYNEEAVQRRLIQEKANDFRAERENTQKLTERNSAPLRCPKCNSTQVSIGQRGFTITTGFLGSNKTMNRCGNCGYKWYPKEK